MVSKQWHFSQIEKANNNFLICSRVVSDAHRFIRTTSVNATATAII